MNAPATVADLIAWFEEHFSCFMGPPQAYFEIPTDAKTFFRGVYESYVVKTRASENQERLLVHQIFDDFAAFKALIGEDRTALFWRLSEKIVLKSESVQLFGELVMTEERVQDGSATVPEGAVLDDAKGAWYEDAGKVTEWTLRTRLCIPALAWTNHPPLRTQRREPRPSVQSRPAYVQTGIAGEDIRCGDALFVRDGFVYRYAP